MPINLRDAPANALTVLASGLQHALVQSAPPENMKMAPGIAPQAAAPHPVYTVSNQDVANGTLLSAAVPDGWRYLIMQGDKVLATGRISEVEGELAFSSLTQGRLVDRTVEAIEVAERAEAVAENDYELRYLEIRSLYFAGLWLHAPDDNLVIPLEDHQDAEVAAYSVLSEERTLNLLQGKIEMGSAVPPPPNDSDA